MPVFTTDYYRNLSTDAMPATSRVEIPITDPEFNVSYYLACEKEHAKKLIRLL